MRDTHKLACIFLHPWDSLALQIGFSTRVMRETDREREIGFRGFEVGEIDSTIGCKLKGILTPYSKITKVTKK